MVSGDRRTLQLVTGPQSEAAYYAVTLPGLGRSKPAAGEEKQLAEIDVGYELTGAAAIFQATTEAGNWSGWLPHLDMTAARAFTVASAEHETLWKLLEQPGKLTMRTQLDLWQMLRPAVQPGSRLDWTPPPEQVAVTFTSNGPLDVKAPGGRVESQSEKDGKHRVTLHVQPKRRLAAIETCHEAAMPDTTFHTHQRRARSALLACYCRGRSAAQPLPTIPELARRRLSRGRAIFQRPGLKCRCHLVRGEAPWPRPVEPRAPRLPPGAPT